MIQLVVLLSVFLILLLVSKVAYRSTWDRSVIGRISMTTMLFFAGLAHFFNTVRMREMIPDFVGFKDLIIYLTGILEFILATGLLIRKWSKLSSLILIIYFIAVLPSDIIGSIRHMDFGIMQFRPDYLYFRIPVQLFFIIWTYYFGIRINKTSSLIPGE